MGHRGDLLGEIERDLLAGMPTADLLRKTVILGGRAGSAELRGWASRELKGFDGVDAEDLPGYRRIDAPMLVDRFVGAGRLTGLPISSRDLPDGIRDELSDQLLLRQSVSELEALAATGEPVQFGLPGFEIISRLMGHEAHQPQRTTFVYWSVTPATLHGAVDQVRTALAELVGELSAHTPPDKTPTTDQVSQAVHVAIHGGRPRVTVVASQGQDGELTVGDQAATDHDGWWTPARRVGAFVVGMATIVAAVAAILALM